MRVRRFDGWTRIHFTDVWLRSIAAGLCPHGEDHEEEYEEDHEEEYEEDHEEEYEEDHEEEYEEE